VLAHDQHGGFQRLLVVQAGVDGGTVGTFQVDFGQVARATRALGDVLSGELEVHATQPRARGGIPPEEATSQPHVTLAYLERGCAPQAWLEDVDCSAKALRVERFELLFNAGGRYGTLGTWTLSGAALPQQGQLL